MNMKYSCPCCGYYTFEHMPDGSYDICPVCFWEDDPFQLENPQCEGGANHVSLEQARLNYKVFGACEKEMLPHVRKPNLDEMKQYHSMKLQPEPFKEIYSGNKTIELRLNDEKRQNIRIGDIIEFVNTEDSKERLQVEVLYLYHFDSFEELYKNLPLLKCGYSEENITEAKPEDMEKYYTKEKQQQYGVVGIEICVLPDTDEKHR